MENREAFNQYVQENYMDIMHKGSKTITRNKGAKIISALEETEASCCDSHFKHWIKTRGFQLMDYPTLGLRNVLCLPCKNKVIIANININYLNMCDTA